MLAFFFSVVMDHDEAGNMGVENATFRVGSVMERYEKLERYDQSMVYTVRR